MKRALPDIKKDTVRISLFILLACLLVIACTLLFGKDSAMAANSPVIMPALAALLLHQITNEEDAKELFIGFRGKLRYYIAGYYLPIAALALGALIYYLLFPAHFDPNMGNLTSYRPEINPEDVKWSFKNGLFIIPHMFQMAFYLGDAFGWQGYLLPKLLKRFKILPATIILGIAWSIPWFIFLTFLQGDALFRDMGGLLKLVDGPGVENSLLSLLLVNMLLFLPMSVFVTRLTIKTRSFLPALLGQTAYWMYYSLWGSFLAVGVEDHPLYFFITWGPMLALSILSMLRMMKDEREGKLLPPEPEPQEPSAEGITQG